MHYVVAVTLKPPPSGPDITARRASYSIKFSAKVFLVEDEAGVHVLRAVCSHACAYVFLARRVYSVVNGECHRLFSRMLCFDTE